jgi:hypothetical protein
MPRRALTRRLHRLSAGSWDIQEWLYNSDSNVNEINYGLKKDMQAAGFEPARKVTP